MINNNYKRGKIKQKHKHPQKQAHLQQQHLVEMCALATSATDMQTGKWKKETCTGARKEKIRFWARSPHALDIFLLVPQMGTKTINERTWAVLGFLFCLKK